jgi:hypothetical protein
VSSPKQAPGQEPSPTRSGHPRVDAALDALERDSGLPPAEQIAGYDAAHRTLQETLAAIDEGQS